MGVASAMIIGMKFTMSWHTRFCRICGTYNIAYFKMLIVYTKWRIYIKLSTKGWKKSQSTREGLSIKCCRDCLMPKHYIIISHFPLQ